ncbi:TetR/AcrR family transcriptional regulator [Microvirga pudoricolor]|uniref:TetR/AcrR family transcriptional regulator n=1 Tax=Microvirga pudoricolor TaxID=2778729 RepID=UPI0019528B72|nr:TetR/AcrR family transcriptional regulator [Microvirga pudoricolor]MBM6594348.1 TetR/AcrR family transcriptional regulator [Microvirga pudoricolor]
MRVSKEKAAESRQRIVDAASRLFREKGFDGIGVSDLMKSAGLTHGGFYGHFASKEDLVAQACAQALAGSQAKWKGLLEAQSADPLAAIVESYLSTAHRDHPGRGCTMPALGSDVARQGPAVRKAFTAGVRPLLDLLARAMPGRSERARRERALAALAGLVGAMVLSRAVDDPALSEEILDASRREIAGWGAQSGSVAGQ